MAQDEFNDVVNDDELKKKYAHLYSLFNVFQEYGYGYAALKREEVIEEFRATVLSLDLEGCYYLEYLSIEHKQHFDQDFFIDSLDGLTREDIRGRIRDMELFKEIEDIISQSIQIRLPPDIEQITKDI